MAAVMKGAPIRGTDRRVRLRPRRVVEAVGVAIGALVAALATAGQALARVEPPVFQGVPGESSQVGLWLWILLAVVVVGAVAAIAWTRTLRGRTPRIDVYALVGRAIEAERSP
jgi:hypothetical protein